MCADRFIKAHNIKLRLPTTDRLWGVREYIFSLLVRLGSLYCVCQQAPTGKPHQQRQLSSTVPTQCIRGSRIPCFFGQERHRPGESGQGHGLPRRRACSSSAAWRQAVRVSPHSPQALPHSSHTAVSREHNLASPGSLSPYSGEPLCPFILPFVGSVRWKHWKLACTTIGSSGLLML